MISRAVFLSFLLVVTSLYSSKGGIINNNIGVNEECIGFLIDDNSFSSFQNNILNIQEYNSFLGVTDLRFSTINLPISSGFNQVYPYNVRTNSILREASASIGNNPVPNPWEVMHLGTKYALRFARIINDINFSQPIITNPGGNYVASINWDPNISGSTAWGVDFKRGIYKIEKFSNTVSVIRVRNQENSSAGIVSTLGDFNNDNRPDIFTVRTNENNQVPTTVQEIEVFTQQSNGSFSKIIIDKSSWNQGQTRVDLKWTAKSIVASYQKWNPTTNTYHLEKFDYNNDGKQDIVVASADGAVYVIPNTSTQNSISFGVPIKLVTTGLATRDMDNNYNGAQVLNLGDINKDNIVDLVVATTDSPKIYIYYGKLTNEGNIYFGGTNRNVTSNPDLILYDGQVTRNQSGNVTQAVVIRGQGIEDSQYRGPSTQKGPNNSSPVSEYTGGATQLSLADINRDGELDIMIATDNWHFLPTHLRIGNNTQQFNLTIVHQDRNNASLSAVGGRVFLITRNPQTGKYKTLFLGQFAITNDNQNADFDDATIINFSGPTSSDFIATDGNHAQTLFTFLQNGISYVNADRFIVESKDLVKKPGTTNRSFDFNSGQFYIKSITLRIVGTFNNIPTTIKVSNRINNNSPEYISIDIPQNLLNNLFTDNSPLEIYVELYPSNSNYIRYRINNTVITTNQPRIRGSHLVYRLEFNTSNQSFKTMVQNLSGQMISGLNTTVEINKIQVFYEALITSLRITSWKELR
ncbi:MAG: VCBS repeat-containing protein [bacterium]